MGFTCYVEVVGSGASSEAGTFPGVFLFLDNNRYLFGCGEGTQRLLGESRVRFNCIGTVFLTGLSWGEAGGVIGASLTMSEMGNKNVRLMGPIGLADYIQDSASFILKKDLIYNLHEFSSVTLAAHPELGRYTDGVITVVPVPVERSPTTEEATAATTTSSPAPNSCPLPMGRKPLCSMERTIVTATETRLRVKGMDERKEEYAEATGTLQPDEKQPKIESDALSPTYEEYNDGDYSDLMFRSDSVAVSYICHVPDTPGKFLTAKADELGVPKGPDRGRLVHGETIKTPAGRVVRPEECISPVTPGPVFIVVACPDEAHIAGLAASKTFEPYYHTDSEGKVGEMSGRVVCVVHFGPKKVVEHEEYRKWAGRFRSEARNIFVGEGFQATPGRIDFERFGNTQARLSAVSRDLYPLVPVAELDTREEVEALGKLFCNAEVPPRNTRYTFVDGYTARVEAAPESTYNPEKEAAEAAAIVGDIMKVDAKEDSKEEIEVEEEKEKEKHIAKTAPNAFVPLPEDEFRITFMGTGASLPSRHRNVAGILVQVGGHNSPCILLDCGENTYGQMCRFFGRETAKNIIQNHLIAIAISHSHADHHLGIAQILHLKSTATAEESRKFPIHLISSATVLNWVRHYAAAARVPHILAPESLKMVPIKEVCEEVRSDVETFFARYGIMLRSVLVEHCYDAHGYVVVGKGWKISYSGDSRPLESFAVAASNSTVLIHEATLSDNMKAEAIVKKHSTIEEAISIGKMSQSEHTVLTHFSQRFPKLSDSMLVEASNFIYGSDMLTFTRSQLPQLMKLAPAIAAVLKSNEEEAAAGGDEPKQETAAINENKAKGGKKHKKRTTENFKI